MSRELLQRARDEICEWYGVYGGDVSRELLASTKQLLDEIDVALVSPEETATKHVALEGAPLPHGETRTYTPGGWIDSANACPDKPGFYWCWTYGMKSPRDILALEFTRDGLWNYGGLVTHWMPMPERPLPQSHESKPQGDK